MTIGAVPPVSQSFQGCIQYAYDGFQRMRMSTQILPANFIRQKRSG
jgi:hypothetical protein